MQNKLPLMGFLCPHARFCRSLQNFNLVLNAKVSFDVSQSNITPITARANIELNVLARRWRERHLETQLCFVVLSFSSPPRSVGLQCGASEIRGPSTPQTNMEVFLSAFGLEGEMVKCWGSKVTLVICSLPSQTGSCVVNKVESAPPANRTQSSSLPQNINQTSGAMTSPIKSHPNLTGSDNVHVWVCHVTLLAVCHSLTPKHLTSSAKTKRTSVFCTVIVAFRMEVIKKMLDVSETMDETICLWELFRSTPIQKCNIYPCISRKIWLTNIGWPTLAGSQISASAHMLYINTKILVLNKKMLLHVSFKYSMISLEGLLQKLSIYIEQFIDFITFF